MVVNGKWLKLQLQLFSILNVTVSTAKVAKYINQSDFSIIQFQSQQMMYCVLFSTLKYKYMHISIKMYLKWLLVCHFRVATSEHVSCIDLVDLICVLMLDDLPDTTHSSGMALRRPLMVSRGHDLVFDPAAFCSPTQCYHWANKVKDCQKTVMFITKVQSWEDEEAVNDNVWCGLFHVC